MEYRLVIKSKAEIWSICSPVSDKFSSNSPLAFTVNCWELLSKMMFALEMGTSNPLSINWPVTRVRCCPYSTLQQQSTAQSTASLIAYCRLMNKKGVVIAVQIARKRTILLILATKSK